MTAKSAELLDSLERRMLRRIYGPVNTEGIWRILNEAPVGRTCSTDARNAGGKKVFFESMGGKRLVGKPRARWEDSVSKDTRDQLERTVKRPRWMETENC
ncbi:hypothetical protein J437_LFUL018801 [Ladona fulva]|uniref:Uncharacterized protein n=1 Tax=Ladona fulva TaxID=123851 RepID=A0A8K0PBL7_LADFU|nr:hypothetical protein J437_LFUL018801 [Ladona fulva]